MLSYNLKYSWSLGPPVWAGNICQGCKKSAKEAGVHWHRNLKCHHVCVQKQVHCWSSISTRYLCLYLRCINVENTFFMTSKYQRVVFLYLISPAFHSTIPWRAAYRTPCWINRSVFVCHYLCMYSAMLFSTRRQPELWVNC